MPYLRIGVFVCEELFSTAKESASRTLLLVFTLATSSTGFD